MAKTKPTREQVLDALQTHKTVNKAAIALGVSYPEMQKYLRQYGICANHSAKDKPVDTQHNDDEHAFRHAVNNWYKKWFKKGDGK